MTANQEPTTKCQAFVDDEKVSSLLSIQESDQLQSSAVVNEHEIKTIQPATKYQSNCVITQVCPILSGGSHNQRYSQWCLW